MHFKPYPEYKDSGVEWLGEVPAHWKAASIGKIFHIYSGATPKSENAAYWNGSIRWATNTDFSRNLKFIDKTSRSITEAGYQSCGTKLLPKQSLILTTRAGIGSVLINTIPMCTNQGCKGLVPKKRINISYAYYLILSSSNALNAFAKGTTFTELSTDSLNAFQTTLPAYEEQNKITSFLDQETSKIDILISKQERLIELLEEQRKSIISHAVTKGLNPDAPMKDSGVEWLGDVPAHWERASLKFLCDVRDGTHETPTYVDQTENTFPLVTSKNIANGKIFLNDCKYISSIDYYNIIKRSKVDKGDILMPMIGTVGGAALVEEKSDYAIKNVALFKSSTKLNAQWLLFTLSSNHIHTQFALRKSGGVQDFIALGDLRNLFIVYPPDEEQRNIIDSLDQETSKIDIAISKQKLLIEKLKEYRSSVISHAVTGKIDVRELAA